MTGERPRDDVAQVVLRALLAWPLLGVVLGEVTRGAAARLFGLDAVRATLFGAGAGLAAGLVLAAVELGLGPIGRRWRRLRPGLVGLELSLLAALAPAALLGGAFATLLAETGSSAGATRTLVERFEASPGALVDLDASASVGLVLSGLVVGRALGCRPAAQASLGAWAVVVGLLARLAAGRLTEVPLLLVLAVEGTAAALGPVLVAVADRAVRAARRAEGARLVGLLLVAAFPIAVAASWSLALRRALPPDPGLAWVFPLVFTSGAVLALRLERLVGAGPTAPVRFAGAALLLAVGGGLAAGLATCTGPMGGPLTTGWDGRVTLGLRLGADPAALLRRVEEASERAGAEDEWLDAVVLPRTGQLVGELRPLLVLAADGGDVQACLELTRPVRRPVHVDGLSSDERRWLRTLLSLGELQGAERLLDATDPGDPDALLAADALLDAARRGDPRAAPGLQLVADRCPARRAALDALLEADPWAWQGVTEHLLGGRSPPARPLLRTTTEQLRAWRRRHLDVPAWLDRVRLFGRLLRFDPTLVSPGDAELLALEATPPPGWAAPLATTDLGPLDPERDPALAAAARGDWAAVWSLTSALGDGARDRERDAPLLRARAHALLAEARSATNALGGLRLADSLLAAGGGERLEEAAATFDLVLHELHRNLCPAPATRTGVSAELLARLDLVDALRDGERTSARVEALRARIVRLFGPPDPGVLAGQRRALARSLRDGARRAPPVVVARQRAAADRLEALR